MNLEQHLTDVGDRRRDAELERNTSAALLRQVVREAADEGWPKTRIAKVAGISRQTVHEMLRKEHS